MPFFTDLDPRAAIKGSRDPLGYQSIWASLGRHVVGNLTTVTTSVRNFTTLLLGLYFTDLSIARGESGEGDRVDMFLKFEQLAAYSRYAYGDPNAETPESPRGLQRVKRRIDESGKAMISAKQEHQILSAQKTYGLWGLYTVAARQSGLVEQRENRLTPHAMEFVKSQYEPRMANAGSQNQREILRYLRDERTFSPKGEQRHLGRTLAELLSSKFAPAEVAFYDEAVVRGAMSGCDHTHGRQARLWETIIRLNNAGTALWDEQFGFREVSEARSDAEQHGDEPLARALNSIEIIEPVLAATARLFSYILLCGEATVATTAEGVRRQWGSALKHLKPDEVDALSVKISEATSRATCDRIMRMSRALHAGEYADAIRTAIDLNADVMKGRGGAPWVTIEGGRLKVRLREESGSLPEVGDLPSLWQNTYFINSLKWIGRTLHGEGA